MPGPLSRLVRQGGMYALGNTVVKLTGLVLAPLYLNPSFLAQEAYGQLILLEATWQFAIILGGFGIATGMLKFQTEAVSHFKDAVPFTALVWTTLLALALFAFMILFSRSLAFFLLDDPGQQHLIFLMAAYMAFKVIGGIPYMLIRIDERAGLYTFALAIEMLVLVGGVYYALVVLDLGLLGVMVAHAASAGISALVLTSGMLIRVEWRFSGRLLQPLMRYGAPLALAGISAMLLNVGDRYILKWFTEAEVVAVYGWAAKLGGVLNMLFVQSFQLAFLVIGLKMLGEDPAAPAFFRRTFRHYVIWTGWAVLGLSLLSYDITGLIAGTAGYLAVEPLVLPIALGFFFYGIYYIVVSVLYASGRTATIAYLILLAVILNIVLNVLLIPWLAAMGAALATTASYGALVWMTQGAARRRKVIDYDWAHLGIVMVLIVVLYLLSRPSLEWDLLPRLGWRFLLIIGYPLLIIGTRLYTAKDARAFWQMVRRTNVD